MKHVFSFERLATIATVVTVVIVLTFGNATGQELTAPSGAYRHCVFRVTGTVEEIGQVKSQPEMHGEVHLSFRDQECTHAYMLLRGPLDYHGVLELTLGEVDLSSDGLRGTLGADFPVGRPSPGSLAFDFVRIGERLEGDYRWQFAYPIISGKIENAFVGKADGTILSADALRRQQAVPSSESWPTWSGPTASMSAFDPDAELLDSLWDACLVWMSEAEILAGRGGEREGGGHPYGGYASPIVADGKVFLNQWAPSGDVVAEKSQKTTDRRIDADDVVFCFDAATGQLLWKQVFAGAGLNQASANKHVYTNNTGCWAGGRVYMYGFTWRVYCLDGDTGKLIWQSDIGEAHEELERAKAEALKTRQMLSPKEPNKYLDVADGVPFTYNLRGEVVAFDPDTGRRLWTAPSSTTISRWPHDGREYIITERSTRGQREAVCLVPKTGEPVWISPIEGQIVPLSITPEFFAAEIAAKEASTLNIYRLGPGGAAKHATVPLPGRLQGWQCASGGDLFISFRPEKPTNPVTRDQGTIARVDLAAGRMVASTKWQRVTWSNAMFAWADRLVYLNDMAHAHAPLNVYEAESLKPLGPLLWNQLHLPTSAYDAPMSVPYVDGRLFFRGMKRLACYDIRRRPPSRRRTP